MSNPETRGNPAQQAMQLIASLETKVREKNQIIDDLKKENEQIKMKLAAGFIRANWSTLVIGTLIGAVGVIVGYSIWR